MDEQHLFAFFQHQEPAVLIEILQRAYRAMSTKQRQAVFGALVQQLPPVPVDEERLQSAIHTFSQASVNGTYYAPFPINAHNFSDVPEETDAWFAQLGNFLAQSTTLTDQGQPQHACTCFGLLYWDRYGGRRSAWRPQHACTCFGLLYALIEQMERGAEIVFAEEVGSWRIPGDEKVYLRAYIRALADTATPEAFTEAVIPLLRRESYASFIHKVYASAIRIANTKQKAQLKAAITRHQIKIKP